MYFGVQSWNWYYCDDDSDDEGLFAFEVCPQCGKCQEADVAAAPTAEPTAVPTASPTPAPTTLPAEAPTGAPTPAPVASTTTAQSTGPSPTPSPTPEVEVRMTVVGVDFALLDADESLRADFELTCQETVAGKAGVPLSVVEVRLSQGSVVVLATIRVPSGSQVTADEVESDLQTDGGIGASIVSSVSEIGGIEGATDGSAISVADVQVAIVEAAPLEVPSTSSGPKAGSTGSTLVLTLVSTGVACTLLLLTVCAVLRRTKARRGGAAKSATPTAKVSDDLEVAVPAAEALAAATPLGPVTDVLAGHRALSSTTVDSARSPRGRVSQLEHTGCIEETGHDGTAGRCSDRQPEIASHPPTPVVPDKTKDLEARSYGTCSDISTHLADGTASGGALNASGPDCIHRRAVAIDIYSEDGKSALASIPALSGAPLSDIVARAAELTGRSVEEVVLIDMDSKTALAPWMSCSSDMRVAVRTRVSAL